MPLTLATIFVVLASIILLNVCFSLCAENIIHQTVHDRSKVGSKKLWWTHVNFVFLSSYIVLGSQIQTLKLKFLHANLKVHGTYKCTYIAPSGWSFIAAAVRHHSVTSLKAHYILKPFLTPRNIQIIADKMPTLKVSIRWGYSISSVIAECLPSSFLCKLAQDKRPLQLPWQKGLPNIFFKITGNCPLYLQVGRFPAPASPAVTLETVVPQSVYRSGSAKL